MTPPVPGPSVSRKGAVEPFRIDIPEAVLADLRERLAATRWPIAPRPVGVAEPWRHGTSLPWMHELVDHWLNRYDWRRWETELNRWPNYKAVVGGKRVHFIREEGSGPAPLTLLMSHGWPGSVTEFLKVIDPLAHPERYGGDARDAFTVVVPSLPGYGFSEPPDQPISHHQIGTLWHELMTVALGCTRYGAQAGDVGAGATSWLALDHPEGLVGIHLNMMSLQPDIDPAIDATTAEEREWIAAAEARRAGNMAYQLIQGTKHQTLTYGLTDSPAGLAAWMLEKFHGWTVPGTQDAPPFDLDHLITNVMLHWLQGPNAPTWTYRFTHDPAVRRMPRGRRIEIPTGMLLGPQDIVLPPPDSWIRRSYNLVRRRDADVGGHFMAFQRPELFVEDVREFFRPLR